MWKYFSKHKKTEGMIKFDISHILAENSALPQWYAFSELYSKQPKFIKKCPCSSSLKTKFYWTQIFFWPLIRKILMWIFWVMLWSKSIPSTPIQPWGVIGAPLSCNFKNVILGSVPSIYTEVLALPKYFLTLKLDMDVSECNYILPKHLPNAW